MPDPADLEALIQRVRDENSQRRQRHELPLIEREILGLVQGPSSDRGVFQSPVGHTTTTTSAKATERTRGPAEPADRVEREAREARPAMANEADPCTTPAASGSTGAAPHDGYASGPGTRVGAEAEAEAETEARAQAAAPAASSRPDTVVTVANGRAAPDTTLRRLVRTHRELATLVVELREADTNLSQLHDQLRSLYEQLARPDVLRLLDALDTPPVWEGSADGGVVGGSSAGEEAAQ